MIEYKLKARKYNIKAIQFNEYNNYTVLKTLDDLKLSGQTSMLNYQQVGDNLIVLEIGGVDTETRKPIKQTLDLKLSNYLVLSNHGKLSIMTQTEFKKQFELVKE